MKLGGEVAQRRPDSILAVFCNNPDDKKPNHAQRGLHAAILAVHDAVQLAQVVAGKPHLAHLPMLTLAAGVHLGAAELSRRSSGGNTKVHAAGDAVEVARLLEVTAMDLNWSIATSAGRGLRRPAVPTEAASAPSACRQQLHRHHRNHGPRPAQGFEHPPARVRHAARISGHERAGPQARGFRAGGECRPAFGRPAADRGIPRAAQDREGGMASIFLAQAAEGGAPQVLKVMQLDKAVEADGLQRFIQEYALLAQIKHPNVARSSGRIFRWRTPTSRWSTSRRATCARA
jgi:hypothetical protein